jgi:hypothetical protein
MGNLFQRGRIILSTQWAEEAFRDGKIILTYSCRN